MKEEILKLREEGKTYQEIANILKCAKSTVCYHCNDTQKHKSNIRKRKYRKNIPLKDKIDKFRNRVRDFQRNRDRGKFLVGRTYNINLEDVINKIGDNPICYLTGRKIDINNSSSYHLDHILPIKLGGDNSIANLEIACKDANYAKRDLLLEDFIQLCKEVLIKNGYKVIKD